jgi:predicted negative regulator of RcsB-dependent stress response
VAIYDTEEEQVEALQAWWKENKTSLIIGAVLGVAIILGWNFWKNYRQEQALEASSLYGQLLVLTEQEKNESAQKMADQLIEQFPNSHYANYAHLFLAKLHVNGNDIVAAKTILRGLLTQNDIEINNVARLRLVRLMLASKEYEQGLQLIAEVDPARSESFAANYDELTGDLYVALNRLGEARTAYQSAMRISSGSPLLSMKLDDITAAEIITPSTLEIKE